MESSWHPGSGGSSKSYVSFRISFHVMPWTALPHCPHQTSWLKKSGRAFGTKTSKQKTRQLKWMIFSPIGINKTFEHGCKYTNIKSFHVFNCFCIKDFRKFNRCLTTLMAIWGIYPSNLSGEGWYLLRL